MCVRHKISTRTELSRSRAAQFKEIRSLSRRWRSLPAGLPSGLPKRTHRQKRRTQTGRHTHTHTGTRCSLHSSICCLSVCESERQTLRGCFSHRIQQWPLTQTQAHTRTRTRTHTSTHTNMHEHTQAQSSRPVHNVFECASKSNRLSKWQLPWLSLLMCVFPASLYYLLDIYRIYLCPFLCCYSRLGWNFKRSIHDYEFYAYLPTNPLRRNLMKVVVSEAQLGLGPSFPLPCRPLWVTWLSVGCFGACLLPLVVAIYYWIKCFFLGGWSRLFAFL